jgi:hypothetical protein
MYGYRDIPRLQNCRSDQPLAWYWPFGAWSKCGVVNVNETSESLLRISRPTEHIDAHAGIMVIFEP